MVLNIYTLLKYVAKNVWSVLIVVITKIISTQFVSFYETMKKYEHYKIDFIFVDTDESSVSLSGLATFSKCQRSVGGKN